MVTGPSHAAAVASSTPPTRLLSCAAESASRASRSVRISAALLAVVCVALLVTAACLTPDPRGVETHTQLGLWPCGWYLATGRPCPTCGMTTAFAAATHGRLAASFGTQPFGALLAIGAATAFWGGLHVALFGSRLGMLSDTILRPRSVIVISVLFIAAWIYKILAMAS